MSKLRTEGLSLLLLVCIAWFMLVIGQHKKVTSLTDLLPCVIVNTGSCWPFIICHKRHWHSSRSFALGYSRYRSFLQTHYIVHRRHWCLLQPLSCVTSDASVIQTICIAPQHTLVSPADPLPYATTYWCHPAYHFPCATKEWCFQQTLHLTLQWSLVSPAYCLPLCHSKDLTSHKLCMVFHNEGTGNWHSYLSHHCISTLYSTVVEYVGWSRLVRSSVAASLMTCRIPSRSRAATTLATTTTSA